MIELNFQEKPEDEDDEEDHVMKRYEEELEINDFPQVRSQHRDVFVYLFIIIF